MRAYPSPMEGRWNEASACGVSVNIQPSSIWPKAAAFVKSQVRVSVLEFQHKTASDKLSRLSMPPHPSLPTVPWRRHCHPTDEHNYHTLHTPSPPHHGRRHQHRRAHQPLSAHKPLSRTFPQICEPGPLHDCTHLYRPAPCLSCGAPPPNTVSSTACCGLGSCDGRVLLSGTGGAALGDTLAVPAAEPIPMRGCLRLSFMGGQGGGHVISGQVPTLREPGKHEPR
jgi:hypothetical protein